ncbi:MAG: C_GCAxxG_C_C family protein [Candidatus Aminicenantes bacterium]|nr:C_GCAxxG_C_C family protein [Candidatus Aminicenantes bacterium]
MKTSPKFIGRKEKINRRTFFTKSFGISAGLTLLAYPGISTRGLTEEGGQLKKGVFKELDEKVVKFMPIYRSCALTSFAVLNDHFKLNADTKTIRALMPFTGGIVRKGETCGAVSGALLALGFFFESIDKNGNGQQPGSSLKHGTMFFDRFEKAFGSTRCKEVVKHQYGRYYDFLNPEDTKLFMEAAKSGKCLEVVQKAVSIAGDIILKNS